MAGIYPHIPFCKTRHIYCDFYPTTRSEPRTYYVHTLCRKLEMRKGYLKGEPVETVYFGGGTPSQLEGADFRYIFETARENYGMEYCREITLEANLDDPFQEYPKMLFSLPFSHIDMGIQTFDDTTLQLLKRRHSPQIAVEAIHRCREMGLQNISIDLIYGLPSETKERWVNDLRQAIHLDVEHISTYHLTCEEDTPIYNMLKQRQMEGVDEDFNLRFLTLLIEYLQNAGYEHYEISNFYRPDKYSRHNTSYWRGIPYSGCGSSAHSFNGTTCGWSVSSISLYIKGIEGNQHDSETENLDQVTRYNEFVVTTIRTVWGTPIERLKQELGNELWECYRKMPAPYPENGRLEVHEGALCLTREGIFISGSIMSDLFWVN